MLVIGSHKGLTAKDVEQRILEILSKEVVSTSQLAKEIGLKRYLLTGYLEALRNQGKLDLHKVGKSNVYLVRRGLKL